MSHYPKESLRIRKVEMVIDAKVLATLQDLRFHIRQNTFIVGEITLTKMGKVLVAENLDIAIWSHDRLSLINDHNTIEYHDVQFRQVSVFVDSPRKGVMDKIRVGLPKYTQFVDVGTAKLYIE